MRARARSDVALERVAGVRVARLVARPEPLLPLRGRAVRPRLGVHLALRARLDPVVADGGRGVERVRGVLSRRPRQEAGVDGVRGPHAGVAVGLELRADGRALLALAVAADAVE